jgi:hypothetical protein
MNYYRPEARGGEEERSEMRSHIVPPLQTMTDAGPTNSTRRYLSLSTIPAAGCQRNLAGDGPERGYLEVFPKVIEAFENQELSCARTNILPL